MQLPVQMVRMLLVLTAPIPSHGDESSRQSVKGQDPLATSRLRPPNVAWHVHRHKCLRALTRSARPGCVGAPNVVSQLSEESRLTYSVVAVSSARQTILDIGVELMLLYVIVNLSTETLCLWYCHSTFRYINSMAPLCCSLIVLIIISSRRKIHIMVPRRPP